MVFGVWCSVFGVWCLVFGAWGLGLTIAPRVVVGRSDAETYRTCKTNINIDLSLIFTYQVCQLNGCLVSGWGPHLRVVPIHRREHHRPATRGERAAVGNPDHTLPPPRGHGQHGVGERLGRHGVGWELGALWVQGSGFRVQGAGCRVQGAGFRVPDLYCLDRGP